MAELLIRLKLAILRHSLRGGQRTYIWLGGWIGVVLALGTVAASLGPPPGGSRAMDTVAELSCLWVLGWIFVSLAGSDVLLPESFALLPIDRRRLALGLLIASFVGDPARRHDRGLQRPRPDVRSARTGTDAGRADRHRLRAPVGDRPRQGDRRAGRAGGERAVRPGARRAPVGPSDRVDLDLDSIAAVSGSSTSPAPSAPDLASIARVVPTGWGVVAVEAATRSDWPVVIAALGALAILVAALGAPGVRSWSGG